MSDFEPLIVQISKLHLGKDDYLFLKVPKDSPKELKEKLHLVLKESYPELRFLIYDFDIELSVVHQEEK